MAKSGHIDNSRQKAFWILVWASMSFVANAFVIVTVNYWIYRARFDFIKSHPDYVARKPPTISRSISDPLIGDPFAFWIGLSAIVLAFGVLSIAILYLRSAAEVKYSNKNYASIIVAGGVAGFLFQLLSSVGMIMLSYFTFHNNHDLHMLGSYLFFAGQTLVVLVYGLLSWWMARQPEIRRALEGKGLINPALTRIRAFFGPAVTLFACLFLLLFVLKKYEYPFGNEALYMTYVMAEPTAISGYLSFQMLYLADFALIIIGAFRVWIAGPQLSTSA